MPFSRKTVVRLAERAAEAFGHAELDTLFYEYNVQHRDPGAQQANKIKRSLVLVRSIEEEISPKQTTPLWRSQIASYPRWTLQKRQFLDASQDQ